MTKIAHAISPDVNQAITTYLSRERAFVDACQASKTLSDDLVVDGFYTEKEEAEDALIAMPCQTVGDIKAKISLALDNDNIFDSIINCVTVSDPQEHVMRVYLRSMLAIDEGTVASTAAMREVEDADANPALLAVIDDAERKHAAWVTLPLVDGALQHGPEEVAFDQAEEDFIAFPCQTLADVRAKAEWLLSARRDCAATVFYTTRIEERSMVGFLRSLLGLQPNGEA